MGETAIVHSFKTNTSDLKIRNKIITPYELEKGHAMKIVGDIISGANFIDVVTDIDIIYTDKIDNWFIAKITGLGVQVKIVSVNETQAPNTDSN